MEIINKADYTSVAVGETRRIECRNYCRTDSGVIEYAPTQYSFDRPKKFELLKKLTEESYALYINDTPLFEIWEITGFKVLQTKLRLNVCIGIQTGFIK